MTSKSSLPGIMSLLIIFSLFAILSCKKEVQEKKVNTPDAVFPSTDKEKQRVKILKEVGSILQEVYKNAKAYHEANCAIYSGYYDDETVLLKDLLTPQTSPLYQTEKFKSFNADAGAFKKEFFAQLSKGDFPELKKALQFQSANNARMEEYVDTSLEIFSNSSGVSIYFPYSENFSTPLTTEYFDNINTDPFGYLATIVASDRDADEGPGSEPYVYHPPLRTDPPQVRFRNVTVNDDYAVIHPTHIVGVGAEPAKQNIVEQTSQVYIVFLGDVKCTQQYDKLISATGNGGGSELRFIRGSAYLQQNTNGQITNPQDLISVKIKRISIRNGGRWQRVYSIWDPNWEVNDLQQVFAIYEEDTQGSKTITGQLTTTLSTGTPGVTQVGQFGYSFTVSTQDEIIRQINWDRTSFYQYNQGGLNNGCGTRDTWTEYDCNLSVRYNMPEQ